MNAIMQSNREPNEDPSPYRNIADQISQRPFIPPAVTNYPPGSGGVPAYSLPQVGPNTSQHSYPGPNPWGYGVPFQRPLQPQPQPQTIPTTIPSHGSAPEYQAHQYMYVNSQIGQLPTNNLYMTNGAGTTAQSKIAPTQPTPFLSDVQNPTTPGFHYPAAWPAVRSSLYQPLQNDIQVKAGISSTKIVPPPFVSDDVVLAAETRPLAPSSTVNQSNSALTKLLSQQRPDAIHLLPGGQSLKSESSLTIPTTRQVEHTTHLPQPASGAHRKPKSLAVRAYQGPASQLPRPLRGSGIYLLIAFTFLPFFVSIVKISWFAMRKCTVCQSATNPENDALTLLANNIYYFEADMERAILLESDPRRSEQEIRKYASSPIKYVPVSIDPEYEPGDRDVTERSRIRYVGTTDRWDLRLAEKRFENEVTGAGQGLDREAQASHAHQGSQSSINFNEDPPIRFLLLPEFSENARHSMPSVAEIINAARTLSKRYDVPYIHRPVISLQPQYSRRRAYEKSGLRDAVEEFFNMEGKSQPHYDFLDILESAYQLSYQYLPNSTMDLADFNLKRGLQEFATGVSKWSLVDSTTGFDSFASLTEDEKTTRAKPIIIFIVRGLRHLNFTETVSDFREDYKVLPLRRIAPSLFHTQDFNIAIHIPSHAQFRRHTLKKKAYQWSAMIDVIIQLISEEQARGQMYRQPVVHYFAEQPGTYGTIELVSVKKWILNISQAITSKDKTQFKIHNFDYEVPIPVLRHLIEADVLITLQSELAALAAMLTEKIVVANLDYWPMEPARYYIKAKESAESILNATLFKEYYNLTLREAV